MCITYLTLFLKTCSYIGSVEIASSDDPDGILCIVKSILPDISNASFNIDIKKADRRLELILVLVAAEVVFVDDGNRLGDNNRTGRSYSLMDDNGGGSPSTMRLLSFSAALRNCINECIASCCSEKDR